MSIDAMGQTRQAGDNKRLEAITALVQEARDPNKRLTLGRERQLVEQAVASATNLKAASSKRTFRSECELVLNLLENFDDVLALADRIWNGRKAGVHSKYHLVVKICTLLAPRRLRTTPYSFPTLERHYSEHGCLPP